MTSTSGQTSVAAAPIPVAEQYRGLSMTLRATPWVAGLWALSFLALALLGLLDRAPHPWVPADFSALTWLSRAEVSWLLVGLAVLTLGATAVAMASSAPARLRVAGWLLVGIGVVVAVAISDARALTFLGYLPMVLLAVLGVGPAAGHLEWSMFVDDGAPLAHAVGGLAIAATGVLTLSRATGPRGLDWRRWAAWTWPAVVVAAVVPLCYAVTRIAWAAGVPLGVRPEMLEELGSARYAGLGLALFAIVGAWLTTGLVSRWGEVFWRWLPVVGGRPVPVAMAVVPGLFVAGAVTSAGVTFWGMVAAGRLSEIPGAVEDWAAWAPELLWPVWGVALAVASLGYLSKRSRPRAARTASRAEVE